MYADAVISISRDQTEGSPGVGASAPADVGLDSSRELAVVYRQVLGLPAAGQGESRAATSRGGVS